MSRRGIPRRPPPLLQNAGSSFRHGTQPTGRVQRAAEPSELWLEHRIAMRPITQFTKIAHQVRHIKRAATCSYFE